MLKSQNIEELRTGMNSIIDIINAFQPDEEINQLKDKLNVSANYLYFLQSVS